MTKPSQWPGRRRTVRGRSFNTFLMVGRELGTPELARTGWHFDERITAKSSGQLVSSLEHQFDQLIGIAQTLGSASLCGEWNGWLAK